jgi:hypothetical protein
MQKFTSIESFKHIVANVRKYYNKVGKPFPTLTYTGRVKLHGTNAGVRRTPSGQIIPQSRERIIDVTSDNNGFAFFVETNKEAIAKLFEGYPQDETVTLYGEWCGGSIQKGVALNNVPKHWVLFAAKLGVKAEDDIDMPPESFYTDVPADLHDNAHGIYNIAQIPSYEVTIDFLSPEPASVILSELTLAVEEECPWGKLMFDVSGIGEGIVWRANEYPNMSRLWFKTKGLLHKGNDKTKQPKIEIDDKQLASIKELVEKILTQGPSGRLEQGLSYLRENNHELTTHSTGVYLKWVAGDILKEELGTIAASGFDWKRVQGQVMQVARQYFLTAIDKEFV